MVWGTASCQLVSGDRPQSGLLGPHHSLYPHLPQDQVDVRDPEGLRDAIQSMRDAILLAVTFDACKATLRCLCAQGVKPYAVNAYGGVEA
jgi:hypothetical protein